MIIPFPMPLSRRCEPFDDPDWIFEFQHEGVRAMAVIERGGCRFFSRAKHKLYGFQDLATALTREVTAENAVMDGELEVTDSAGRILSASTVKARKQARYFAFDLVWLNGEDLRALPLLSRKDKLKRILPARSAYVQYVDHARGAGERLFHIACHMGLEGIVAKRAHGPYEIIPGRIDWIQIANPRYIRKERRSKLGR